MLYSGTLIRAGNNAKTVKGDKASEYLTAIMYLAPFKLAGKNVCPMAETAQCHVGCLNTAGRGAFNNVQTARINKTKRYLDDRAAFMAELVTDLEKFVRFCDRRNVKPACRLNGTSDIQFEIAHPVERDGKRFDSVFAAFPEVQFYDYTKVYKRVYRELPENYVLTLSYSRANPKYAEAIEAAAKETGCNVAIVFRTKEQRDSLIKTKPNFAMDDSMWLYGVIDGDKTDLRFLDPKRSIVGLYAKGKAKHDQTGFVIDPQPELALAA